jgi:hypothetical protein
MLALAVQFTSLGPLCAQYYVSGRDLAHVGSVSIALYFSMLSIVFLCTALQAKATQRKIEKVLNATDNPQAMAIRSQLVELQHGYGKQMVVQCLLMGIFAWIPYLWEMHCYVLPVQWFAQPTILNKTFDTLVELIHIVDPTVHSSSRRERRNKKKKSGKNAGVNTTSPTAATDDADDDLPSFESGDHSKKSSAAEPTPTHGGSPTSHATTTGGGGVMSEITPTSSKASGVGSRLGVKRVGFFSSSSTPPTTPTSFAGMTPTHHHDEVAPSTTTKHTTKPDEDPVWKELYDAVHDTNMWLNVMTGESISVSEYELRRKRHVL